MNYGWVRRASALAMVAVLAGPLAACDRGTAAPDETAAQNLRAAEFFLTSNARVEGVKTLPSGVQYKVVQSGPPGGEHPDRNDLVRVDYEGTLTDGTVFDSSVGRGPFEFNIGMGEVIEGWDEGVLKMSLGQKARLHVPSAMGYGEQGAGGIIPPNADLVFDVELLKISPSGHGHGHSHGGVPCDGNH